jgi:hypothetical protein
MADVIHFPGQGSRSGGGGPEDPMLEQRVARLEEDIKDIKASLRSIENKLNSLAELIAQIKGQLSGYDARFASLPTTWTLLGIIFTTWALGSGILIFAMNLFLKR